MLLSLGVANPIVLLEEIDKAGGSAANGSVTAVLLSLLDARTAAHWRDDCLDGEADLSHLGWVLTANNLHGVPEALRSRCMAIKIVAPPPQWLHVMLEFMQNDLADEMGLDRGELPAIEPGAMRMLARLYEAEGDLRKLARALRACMGAAIRARIM